MKYWLTLLFSFLSLLMVAQSGDNYVSGQVRQQKDSQPIAGAIIQALNAKDSTVYNYYATTTNENGQFELRLKQQKYILRVYSMGYTAQYIDIEPQKATPKVELEAIFLKESAVQLHDTEIIGSMPPIIVKGDTIEYNANSYHNDDNDLLNDLLKRIPGIQIDANGNITANGKPIKKILVDGKEFFGNDIAMALGNLPANMVKKLQLFKEDSEEAKVTGIKDKNPEQVLNLQVKDEFKRNIFGNASIGYGSDNKYAHKALVNYMNNDNQFSAIGEANNVNTEAMSSSNGIDRNKNAGFNFYNQDSEKFKLGGFLRYSENKNTIESQDNSYNFSLDRYSKQSSSSDNQSKAFNIGANMSWTPDSMTMLYVRTSITFDNTDQKSSNNNLTYTSGQDTTDGFSHAYYSGNGFSINNTIVFGRRLGTVGRNIGIMINNVIQDSDNKGSNYSETNYSGIIPQKIIDQQSTIQNKTNNIHVALSYSEPLGKDMLLQFKYTLSNNVAKRDRNAWRKDDRDNYTIIDTAYTRYTNNKYLIQTIGSTFQLTKEKYNLTIGFDIMPTYSRSIISLGDSLIEKPKQHTVNYSPNIHLSYNPDSSSSFDFNYSGSTEQPSLSQLSTDTVIINALMKNVGNVDLKPSFSNDINMYYQKSDFESGRFMMISARAAYIFNNIVDYSFIDRDGNTIRSYKNIDGNTSASLGFLFNTPLKNKKFTLSSSSYINYSRSIGFTNEMKSTSNNTYLYQLFGIQFRNEKVDINLRTGATHNIIKNNLAETEDRNNTTYRVNNEMSIKLPFDFLLQSYLEYTYYAGYQNDFKNSELLWNASIAKNFLKQKKGTLRMQLFDIFDDRNPITRTVSGDSYSDSRTNYVNRYILFSFSYRFNIAKGNKEADNYFEDYNTIY